MTTSSPTIRVRCLGAGQDVGRSCVLVTLDDSFCVMFDCGMHMGFNDSRRYPNFASISPGGSLSSALDAVVVTHFHLDHCGALPVLVGGGGGGGGSSASAGVNPSAARGAAATNKAPVQYKYDGPIYMTYPTKAMLPLMLEDFHKLVTSRGGGAGGGGGKEGGGSSSNENEISFSRADIDAASRAAVAVPLHATVPIAGGKLTLRAFYAGHVLGAAMFEVRVASGNSKNKGLIFGDRSGSLLAVDGASVLYSGDYNMTPDRHLGPARPLRTRPDVFITESTYATTVRGPKKQRERELLDAVVAAVSRPRAGKVLIPVFALGRAQELMCLIEDRWSALGLWQSVPVFYSAGMVPRANAYFRLLTGWAAERVRARAAGAAGSAAGGGSGNDFSSSAASSTSSSLTINDRPFEFSRMRPFRRGDAEVPGPCVLFATPGMLHGGQSLEVFKAWAPDPRNLIVLPGYCVSGTVGAKLMAAAAPTSGGGIGANPSLLPPPSRRPKRLVDIDKRGTSVDVQCQVAYLSFSAHADAKGIADAVAAVAPGAVVLVHGESTKMSFLKAKLESSQGVPVHMPANGEEISIKRAGGGGFSGGGGGGGGGGGRARQQHQQRVVGALAAPSVAAAVVGKSFSSSKKKKKSKSSPPPPLDGLDPVSAAGDAVDAGWRPSPAHSALVELVLRPRRSGGFGVSLANSNDDGDDEDDGDDDDDSDEVEDDDDDDENDCSDE